MKMIRIRMFFLCAFLVTCVPANPSHAVDKSGAFTILSMGTKSCGQVVADFKENSFQKINNSIWVAGYLTAINEHIAVRANIAKGIDPAAWDLWINNYCDANPLESLSSATTVLVTELLKRSK
ncbi:MAG: hypothetical protein AB2L12_07210 [Smithellaceae bacterium]